MPGEPPLERARRGKTACARYRAARRVSHLGLRRPGVWPGVRRPEGPQGRRPALTPVFTSPTGTPLRHNNCRRRVWLPALAEAGLNELHFHDLRHAGNELTAATGATLREMMDRMGHSSPRVALTYMHGNDARQRKIADSLSKLAQSELSRNAQRSKDRTRRKPSGPSGCRATSRAQPMALEATGQGLAP
jgi:integrase